MEKVYLLVFVGAENTIIVGIYKELQKALDYLNQMEMDYEDQMEMQIDEWTLGANKGTCVWSGYDELSAKHGWDEK